MADRPIKAATPPKTTAKHAKGCQLGDLFKLLGESHVLDILHLTLNAPRPQRFIELQKELHMSPNTLTDRLQGLVRAGLLTRQAFNEIPPRVEYGPTPKAIEFEEAFRVLTEWAQRNTLKAEPVLAATT